ncbi:response regulator [Metabacillus herbersteinensis]|uniref:Response regulator n=1 Tax=Metabacillus herbersteinensis TaxID=283816 RepID=A0ABV6GBM8_9BACI
MTQSISVMLIEDDEVALKLYEEFTKKLDGFQVVASTTSGKQALEILRVITPDLILLDVFLPDMNGLEVLREIRKENHSVDVILITAANDVETVSEAMRGGAFSYLIKPIIIDKLFDTLRQYKQSQQKLKTIKFIDKGEIDQFFRLGNKSTEKSVLVEGESLPKGIDKHTLKKVRALLAGREESINNEELAQLIGASHSTVRRYMEYLVATNEFDVEVIYGTVGRPERRYRPKR